MMFQKSHKIVAYTDGSCLSNGKQNSKGGVGIFYLDNSPDNRAIEIEDAHKLVGLEFTKPTNNKAELLAIYIAILQNKTKLKEGYQLEIRSDSKYSIDCLTKWYHKWLVNDWINTQGKQVLNKDILEPLITLILSYPKDSITFKHVKAHNLPPSRTKVEEYTDWYSNAIADKLATAASYQGTLPKEIVNKYINENNQA